MNASSFVRRFHLILVFLLCLLAWSCRTNPANVQYPFQFEVNIPATSYSTSYYFLDTLYRKFYEPLHSSTAIGLTEEMVTNRIVDIDVWISLSGVTPNPNARKVIAYIDLPYRLLSDPQYPESYDTLSLPVDGGNMTGQFIKLDPTQYRINYYGGYIAMNTPPSDNQAIAVAYRIQGPDQMNINDDLICGEFGISDTTERPLIVKLIKPKNLIPEFRLAWNLQLKNIYPLFPPQVKDFPYIPHDERFKLHVVRSMPRQIDTEYVNGQLLLQVLGLDRFNANRANVPDNVFDFIPGLTVDPDWAEIIFPSLRPFDSTIVQYFRNKGLTVADSFLFSDIYDTTKSVAQNIRNMNYSIKASFKNGNY